MSVIGEYLETLPPPQRLSLARIGAIVKREAPGAEEAMSYGMPAFMYQKRPLLGFKAHKNHLGLYPFSPSVIQEIKHELEGFEFSKGTIRFTENNPLSEDIIKKIITLRLKEIIP